MKAGTPASQPPRAPGCPPQPEKFQAGRSTLPALLSALMAAAFTCGIHAQDAGLWPVETSRDGPALQPAGERKAKVLTLYLRASQTLREAGPAAALPLFREALALDPGNSTLLTRLASMANATGDPGEARRLLEEATRLHPGKEAPLLELLRFQLDQAGENAEARAKALTAVREAAAKFPFSAGICRLAVRLHIKGQRRDEAQAAVRGTLAAGSDDPAFWLTMAPVAREAFPLDDPDTREAHTAIVTGCVEKALATGGDQPAVLEEAADFYARLPAHEKAVECYRRLIDVQPGNLNARRKLGQCLRLTGDAAGARLVFEELLRIDAGDAAAHRAMASILDAAGEARESLTHRTELLRIEGGPPADYLTLADQLQKAGMAAERRLTLERGFFTHPRSARLSIALASALHLAGRLPEATRQYETSSELAATQDPAALDDAFHLARAECAKDSRQPETAALYFRRAIEKIPKGKPERAVPAYRGMAMLWLESGVKLEEARELLRLASALKKDDPGIHDALGLYAARKNDWPSALKEYLKAEELTTATPLSVPFLLRVTDALEHNGQKAGAITRLEKALSSPEADPALRARLDALRKPAP